MDWKSSCSNPADLRVTACSCIAQWLPTSSREMGLLPDGVSGRVGQPAGLLCHGLCRGLCSNSCVDTEALTAPRGFSSSSVVPLSERYQLFLHLLLLQESEAGSIPQELSVVVEVCLCSCFCLVSCHGALMEAETLSSLRCLQ